MVAFFCLCSPISSMAYSVLTHEAIIDANWEKSIQPLLKAKYPGATDDQLKQARAYAYGGAVAPDMGYFPFGSIFFTNLVHYVRSGDFVNALLTEAADLNEYAFALGALCHYYADNYGHPLGTNRCVPLVYPKMKQKYGDVVTYAQDHISHIRMEFGFDVLQTARGTYASQAYHDFIGFQVARPVLERAFLKTYGLDINDVFVNLSVAISSFRWAVMNLFPVLTRAAWKTRGSEIVKSKPGITSRNFIYRMHKRNYYEEYGQEEPRPRFFSSMLSLMIRILPKIGPLKVLKFKVPGPEVEKLFIQSFDTVSFHYATSVKYLDPENIQFANIDFDTGKKTSPGEYELADENYGNLVLKLQGKKFDHLNPSLKKNILAFYGDPGSAHVKKDKNWEKIKAALEELKATEAQ
jgi:Zinc dependent phospholipase C